MKEEHNQCLESQRSLNDHLEMTEEIESFEIQRINSRYTLYNIDCIHLNSSRIRHLDSSHKRVCHRCSLLSE